MTHRVRLPGLFLSRAALVAGVLAAGAVGAPPAAVAQSYSFSSVAVEGNQRIEPRTILNFARIPRAQAVSAAELNDAYQRLIGSGLFEEVTITPRGGRLVIAVKEFPTVNIVNFEGNRLLKAEELSQLIESRSRRVFSPTQAEADAAAIAEAYAQRGRLAARVEPRIIRRSDNRVDVVFEIAEGRVTEVERLSFVGNRAFSDRRLRQVLETKQAGLLRQLIARDTYAAERVEMDKQLLRDFYQSRGFIDAQVVDATAELARERDGFFVTFTVREGLQYRFGATRVVSEIDGVDAAAYEQLVRLRAGTIYTPSDVEGVIARMEALASRQGVNFLRVEPRIRRNDRDQTLDIDFALVRGERIFVERIDIEGNTTTADQVIRRQFATVEGDPLNPRDIRRAAERIRALGFFEDASVEATEGSTPEAVVVKTTVTEKPTGSLSFGASYGKADGVGFSIGLSESNFLGRGQFVSLDLNLGASNATSSFTFSEPALLGRDLKLTFSGVLAETEANFATWDTRLAQLGVALEFPLSENLRMDTRLTLNKSRVSNVAATSSPILQREAARGSLFGAGLGYSLGWDNRRSGLAGDTAVVLRFGQDLYGLGGDLRYLKTEVFAGAQTRVLSGDVVLRAEFEGGVVAASGGRNTRVTERFFLDGKMRGFQPFGVGPRDTLAGKTDPLGGNAFAVARFEAEFPLGLPEEYGIRGGAFLDIGSVWGLDDVAGTGVVDDSLKLRSSVGLSLLWDTPLGPLRFNFSKALKKQPYDKEQSFDLTISTKF
jgi:outer membrane protein insertion porin family